MSRNYDDPVYKRARSNVLKRDDHCCQMPSCGSKKRLNVHHIKPWSKAAALRFDENNLITLCRSCHDSIKNVEHAYEPLFMSIIHENNKRH